MSGSQSGFDFKLMALGFRIRDFVRPRVEVLREAGIGPGWQVLDYGCGPGSYAAPLAALVGPSGRIYALDINPAAIRAVERVAAGKGIDNLVTIMSDCGTGLPDRSVDAVLLYDTFHDLSHPDMVLHELHRVLKDDGILSFSDHHLDEQAIVTGVAGSALFKLAGKGRHTYTFAKVG